jgi:hypothetical protein
MFVLLVTLLVAAITLTVMNLIAADQAAGIHELQAVEVQSVADAGVQYALGQLQVSGAASYVGQTITVTANGGTVGRATITVNCIDTGSAPPCSGAWAAYRRIVSDGALAIGGPARRVVAVVQGYGLAGSPYALCAGRTLSANTAAAITGNVGSNGSITLQTGATVNGTARANGSITCATSCTAQVVGGATANALGTVCPSLALGPYNNTSTLNQSVSGGSTWTMNSATGYNWNTITTGPGKCNSSSKGLTTIVISVPAGTTQVVQVNQMTLANCSRLEISGGNVDLRIGQATGTGLSVGAESHFGVQPTDSWRTPSPVSASQFLVEVYSSSTCATTCAANIQSTNTVGNAAGVFLAPNGEIQFGTQEQIHGAIVANTITLGSNLVFTYDSSAGSGAPTFSIFDNLRSWKDQ